MTAKLDGKTSQNKDHAVYSASGSERWLKCPASIELCKKAPPQRESVYAAEGTKAHACFEFLLKNRGQLKIAKKVARRNFMDDEMVGHAVDAVEWILEQVGDDESAEVLCETKVDSSFFTCDGQFGTLDATIVREFDRLTVIDYKYGAGVVVDPAGTDGRGNSQLVYYALGVSQLYHHNFSEVELVVIQPRAYTGDGKTTRTFTLSIEDLLAWVPVFQAGVARTNDPKAKAIPGSHCKFCDATPICPGMKEETFQKAQIAFAPDDSLMSVPEPTMITIPNLGNILQACDRLEDWIEKVRNHAHHVLERGGEVPGYKLVEKRGTRKWNDIKKQTKDAVNQFGDVALCEPEILSPAQLEKVFKKNAAVARFIEDNTNTRSSGLTLVTESDKRPAVNPATKAFADKEVITIE